MLSLIRYRADENSGGNNNLINVAIDVGVFETVSKSLRKCLPKVIQTIALLKAARIPRRVLGY